MNEMLLLMVLLFAVYMFLPETWTAGLFSKIKAGRNEYKPAVAGVPEDSVLRRHFITQLRAEIEQELFPRHTDFNLQRHYDTLVAAELESRLSEKLALAA